LLKEAVEIENTSRSCTSVLRSISTNAALGVDDRWSSMRARNILSLEKRAARAR
jgi:hypothetical protein